MTSSKRLTENSDSWHPRPYLSWSQFDKWTRNPNEYIRHYLYGDPEWTNPYMQIGLMVADMLEHDDAKGDPTMEHFRAFLPRYPYHEFAIDRPFAGMRFAGKLDGWDPATRTVGEYKTGLDWSQERADSHRQLDFYCLLVWLLTGSMPERLLLHWIPTRINFFTLQPELTGDIRTFETMRTKHDMLKMAADAKRVWREIGKRCAEERRSMAPDHDTH